MIKKNSLLVDLPEYNVAVTLGLSISGGSCQLRDFSIIDERFTCLVIAALKWKRTGRSFFGFYVGGGFHGQCEGLSKQADRKLNDEDRVNSVS